MKSIFTGFLLVLWILPASTQNLTHRIEQIQQRVSEFVDSQHVPGVAVAVTQHGQLIYAEGFGYADLEQHVPVDPLKTRFRIGSISKSLTAAVLAKMVQEGTIDLDLPIQHYLPDYPTGGGKDKITLRLLGGHLAGIRHYKGEEFLMNRHFEDVTSALELFKDDSLLHAPGSTYSYSSFGFNLISAVMEKAAGKPFLELMEQELFLPLGLIHSGPDQVDAIISGRTRYYVEGFQGEWRNAPAVDNSYKWAGGGFIASAVDLSRFANDLLDPTFWEDGIRDQFTKSQKDGNAQETAYGIGFATRVDAHGRLWFGHSGGSIGGTSNMIIYPESQVVVILLTNKSNAAFGQLNQEIASLLLD